MSNQKEFYRKLNTTYNQLIKEYKRIRPDYNFLTEDVGVELDTDMAELQQQFAAARKGLGLVNKLSYGPSKLKHTKRVMSNLNKIRAKLRRLEKEMAKILT